MTDPFLQTQSEIVDRLANALIGATPDHWNRATLEIYFERTPNGDEAMTYSIWSADDKSEAVEPSEDVYEEGYRLLRLFKLRGKTWRKVVLDISYDAENWKYDVRYEY